MAASATETCRDLFSSESEQCRVTFRQCMNNPFLESLCTGQLENCSNTVLFRLKTCETRQQDCMTTLISNQELCRKTYFQCILSPGSIFSCADDLEACSRDEDASASTCLAQAVFDYNRVSLPKGIEKNEENSLPE